MHMNIGCLLETESEVARGETLGHLSKDARLIFTMVQLGIRHEYHFKYNSKTIRQYNKTYQKSITN